MLEAWFTEAANEVASFEFFVRVLVQMRTANRLELSERNELMSGDEKAEESGGVVRRAPF